MNAAPWLRDRASATAPPRAAGFLIPVSVASPLRLAEHDKQHPGTVVGVEGWGILAGMRLTVPACARTGWPPAAKHVHGEPVPAIEHGEHS